MTRRGIYHGRGLIVRWRRSKTDRRCWQINLALWLLVLVAWWVLDNWH